jgi:hypothetical protein
MAQTTKARPKSKSRPKPKTNSRSQTKAKAKPRSNGSNKVQPVKDKVQPAVKDAGQAVGGAVSKAKVPLVAGGAALAGAAGGLALGARQARRSKPVKVRSQDLAKAAKEVGHFGAQVGRLASELHQARESMRNGGNGVHRSPVEVVLDGLTARRSHN